MTKLLEIKKFSSISLADPFFDSLKKDYKGFEDWFKGKANKDDSAFVLYDKNNNLQGFLYLKDESDEIDETIVPPMKKKKRLKVGTFKIDAHNTRLGERFIKKIMDKGIYEGYEEAYVTVFPKQDKLILLLKTYGFKEYGTKGDEQVLVKDFTTCEGDLLKDYPLIQTKGKRKFLLSIYPKFHTPLFSDSILKNEVRNFEDLVKDVSFSNSIHKIYICFMPKTANLRKGDLLAIYRTNDGMGLARYRSVVTSICQVEEVKTKVDFTSIEDYLHYCSSYSIFTMDDLRMWYRKESLVVIKMTYNVALAKRITRGMLLDEAGISPTLYWGFFQLTDNQFEYILKKGNVNENFIID
ncbi:N-acetyltransferase [uncultured Prevotella sp.]|uniref:N-acetyltransferase n=1 Tax=uncultured Prevotella sp. TaxID=159272 RepID=UPI002610F85B|nr:N-acetyltransferase [uncultured Prevotella sp.]